MTGRPINALELYSRIKGEWDKTSQPLQERATILPLGQYEDGSVGLAWPGLLAAPAEGMANFGRYGYDSPEAIRDNARSAFDVAGGAVTGGLGVGLAGGLADDAVRTARPIKSLQAPPPKRAYDPSALSGEIIDSPQEMIRRAQQSPLWPRSWFEDAGGHPGRPQTYENLLDAARYVYRFEAQDKWDDAVAQAAGGVRPMGNALKEAEAKAFQETPQAWWDSRRTLQEQVEGRDGPMSEFDRVWNSVDMPPTSNVVDELLGSGVINDAYLGPTQRQSRMLRANAPTGSSVPLAVQAMERSGVTPRNASTVGRFNPDGLEISPDPQYNDIFKRTVDIDRQLGNDFTYMPAILNEAGDFPLSPYDVGVLSNKWRNKVRSTGELFANAPTGSSVPLAVNALERQPQGIRAYHGSPHDFDRFSLDKIGTGEGAQAYGHGLYFADSEDVARRYRTALSDNWTPRMQFRKDVTQALRDKGHGETFSNHAVEKIENAIAEGLDPQSVIASVDRMGAPDLYKEYIKKALEDAVPYMEQYPKERGRMYEVNIRANPEDFLDFDAPISAQPAIAQRLSPFGLPDDAKGHGLYNALVDRLMQEGRLEPGVDLSVQVSRALRDAGVPGVKYLDGMSRQAGEGSRNYVVTDDALVDILRKYANAPTGAALPLAAETNDTDPALLEYLRAVGLY